MVRYDLIPLCYDVNKFSYYKKINHEKKINYGRGRTNRKRILLLSCLNNNKKR